jgi:hypothetical protein
MIRHVVLFRFKPDTAATDQQGFLEMLRSLPEKIAEIQSFEAGVDVVRAARSFDLALITSFADLAALDRYVKHEHHQPVVERAKIICEQIVAVDFEF